MKMYQNYIILNRKQSTWKVRTLIALLTCGLAVALPGCGKPNDTPAPEPSNNTGCVIESDIDEALGARLFEYDNKGLLTRMTAPNYYYGPFVRTITPGKVVDAYPSEAVDGNGNHFKGTINIAYTYSGGS